MLARASRRAECDVLLLVRGGGSIEDLWQFNEEAVARAIRACAIPVVVGVGHETDFTIADFAADRRAPTPTAAAELASHSRAELATRVARQRSLLHKEVERKLRYAAQALDACARRLVHPAQRLRSYREVVAQLNARLAFAFLTRCTAARRTLGNYAATLASVDPTAVLARGYSITYSASGGCCAARPPCGRASASARPRARSHRERSQENREYFMGHRLTRIATRTGDGGETGLGDGSRVPRPSSRRRPRRSRRAQLGARAPPGGGHSEEIRGLLVAVQHDLLDFGGELSIPGHSLLKAERVEFLDSADRDAQQDALTPSRNSSCRGKPRRRRGASGAHRVPASREARGRARAQGARERARAPVPEPAFRPALHRGTGAQPGCGSGRRPVAPPAQALVTRACVKYR